MQNAEEFMCQYTLIRVCGSFATVLYYTQADVYDDNTKDLH